MLKVVKTKVKLLCFDRFYQRRNLGWVKNHFIKYGINHLCLRHILSCKLFILCKTYVRMNFKCRDYQLVEQVPLEYAKPFKGYGTGHLSTWFTCFFYLRNVSKGYTKYWLFWKGYSVWNILRNPGTLNVKATLLFIPTVFYFKSDTVHNISRKDFLFPYQAWCRHKIKNYFKKYWPEIYFPKWQPFPKVDSNYWGFQFDH